MHSKALDRFTVEHGRHIVNAIEVINELETCPKILLIQRLLIVSLAAFWEAFHEELCRESLPRHPNPPRNAEKCIDRFHNPEPRKIAQLYKEVLGIPDITESWWGNLLFKTGITPDEFRNKIQRMMELRHDIAHGEWSLPIASDVCVDYMGAVMHLAVRTDEAVQAHLQTLTETDQGLAV